MAVPEFVRRGRELNERGNHLEAVKVCRLGLLAHPSELDGRLTLGAALLALGRFDEVLAEMRVALEIDGLNTTALALKGEALLGRGDGRQALDVLAKASRMALADPHIDALLERARRAARDSHGYQAIDEGSAWTRDYPSHRGSIDAGPEGSGRTTMPGSRADDDDEGDTAKLPSDDFSDDHGPTTIEIDPELEAFEIQSIAEGEPHRGPLAGEVQSIQATNRAGIDETEELDSGDLLPAAPVPADVRGFDSSYGGGPSEPTHAYRGGDDDEADTEIAAPDELEAPLFLDLEPDRPKRAGFPTDRPRHAPPPAAVLRPPAPADPGSDVAALFPEDEDGVSKIELIDEETGLPRSLARMSRDQRPPPPRVIEAPAPQPPAPHGVLGRENRRRSRTQDMEMIRAGLGMSPEPSSERRPRSAPPTGQVPPMAQRPVAAAPSGRRRLSIPALVALAVILLGGGVAGGVAMRRWRTARQLGGATERARQLAASGNYLDELRAAALLDRVLELGGGGAAAAQRARVEAALADEFGAGPRAEELVGAVSSAGNLDAQVARARLALRSGDAAHALEIAGAIAKQAPGNPIGHYLRGRAEAELGRLDAARTSLETARAKGSSPLVAARLSEVYRLSGELEAAVKAAGQGEAPALSIARARAIAAAGELASADEPEATLQALITDAKRPPRKQQLGVSPRQASLATLALAEVALARGDETAARARLAALAEGHAPHDAPFVAAYVQALLAAGDVADAAARHRELAKAWPDAARTHLLGARLALRSGDLAAAREALEGIADLDSNPEALALRGELALESGRIDAAAADLDKALAASPGLAAAVIARGRIDVARGKPEAALERLAKVPRSRARDLVRARAMRAAGRTDEARSLLEALAQGDKLDAVLEIARLERDAGRREQAIAEYDKVLAADKGNVAARLERAEVRFESGAISEAKKTLEALVKEHPDDPRAVLAAARVRTITGDPGGAGELLDAATKLPGTSRWQLERERGRSLLRQRRYDDAVAALERAAALRPTDVETWLLILEGNLRRDDAAASREAVKKASGPLSGSHVLALLRGMEALLAADAKQAVQSFQTARRLLPSTASPRERARFAYWLGRGYESAGDFARARQVLHQAVKLDPSHADAYLTLGDVEVQDRHIREAVEAYRRSAALDPVANPRVFYSLGELYIGEHRFTQARDALEQYLALEPEGDFAEPARERLASIK